MEAQAGEEICCGNPREEIYQVLENNDEFVSETDPLPLVKGGLKKMYSIMEKHNILIVSHSSRV